MAREEGGKIDSGLQLTQAWWPVLGRAVISKINKLYVQLVDLDANHDQRPGTRSGGHLLRLLCSLTDQRATHYFRPARVTPHVYIAARYQGATLTAAPVVRKSPAMNTFQQSLRTKQIGQPPLWDKRSVSAFC